MLGRGGFSVLVLLLPREHGPAHVHVTNAGTEVVIELESQEQMQRVRNVFAMRPGDVVTAFRLVAL